MFYFNVFEFLERWIHAFVAKLSERCFLLFSGPHIARWTLHTNLYKFGYNISSHILLQKNYCDQNLGRVSAYLLLWVRENTRLLASTSRALLQYFFTTRDPWDHVTIPYTGQPTYNIYLLSFPNFWNLSLARFWFYIPIFWMALHWKPAIPIFLQTNIFDMTLSSLGLNDCHLLLLLYRGWTELKDSRINTTTGQADTTCSQTHALKEIKLRFYFLRIKFLIVIAFKGFTLANLE